ncbi:MULTISPECIES: hypothetical protein [Kitasatospora]|uniref:Uncharacterized protein n=2 Tax=Kitasatospora TaxID=2063 RepID=A0ABT1J7D0_9ACTN|nr:hypothetical protein [Kitasatospora paracochleata]MCP2313308.1 hypothetical protein [Kitasatospora paracochleata]
MKHRMRAEYGESGSSGGVLVWHIVRDDGVVAMCGRELDESGALQDAGQWTVDPSLNCHTCGALYLRETPYFPGEHPEDAWS